MNLPIHCLVAALLCGCVVGEELADPRAGPQYLASYRPDTDLGQLEADLESRGAGFVRAYPAVEIVQFAAEPEALEALVGLAALTSIEPVLGVREDVGNSSTAPPKTLATTQVVPWGVSRVGGAQLPTINRLWILDSGVDADHPDLNVDRELSRDIVGELHGDGFANQEHGTAVAGIAAAIDNERDVVGVSPGATVIDVRILSGDGRGRSDTFVAAMDYVAANTRPGDVINLSVVASGGSDIMETAIRKVVDRGARTVLAAGNAGKDVRDATPSGLAYPGVYTVSSIGQDGCLSFFSNYGSGVSFAAPGEDILTLRTGSGTTVVDGTSFAAPHVAGLLLSGALSGEGTVCGDRDSSAEPIAHN